MSTALAQNLPKDSKMYLFAIRVCYSFYFVNESDHSQVLSPIKPASPHEATTIKNTRVHLVSLFLLCEPAAYTIFIIQSD